MKRIFPTSLVIAFHLLFCLVVVADEVHADAALASEFDDQVKALEKVERLSPCQKAVLTALKNREVRELFLAKRAIRCYEFKDICCLKDPDTPDQQHVLFNFDCKPHCLCIVDPQFLVKVDMTNATVVEIVDPYMGPTQPCESILAHADDTHGEDGNEIQESEATTAAAANAELFGTQATTDDAHTSHFNLDNRVFSNDPNPPRTDKFRCFVECVLDNGQPRFYTAGNLFRIPVEEYRTLDINNKNVRVVKCRFWWRLRPLGRLYSSQWIEADPGNYIVYVFLVWHGHNDYDIDSLTQEPIPTPAKTKKK